MKRIMLSILLIFCIGIGLLGCKQQQKTVSQQQQEINKTVTEHIPIINIDKLELPI